MISWSVVKILVIVFQLLFLFLFYCIFSRLEVLSCIFVFADGFLAGVMSKSRSTYSAFFSLCIFSFVLVLFRGGGTALQFIFRSIWSILMLLTCWFQSHCLLMAIYQDHPSWRTKTKNISVRWMQLKRRKDTRRNTWENPFKNLTLVIANVVLPATGFYLLMYITSILLLFSLALSNTRICCSCGTFSYFVFAVSNSYG